MGSNSICPYSERKLGAEPSSCPACKSPLYSVLPVSHLAAIWLIRSTGQGIPMFVVKPSLFYLTMAPNRKSSDVSNSDILLLCLIYKLNFTIVRYVCTGKPIGFSTIHGFKYPLGS